MISIVRWLLGSTANDLDVERDEAEQDVLTSKALRANAELQGRASLKFLADNHFGERMAAALEPKGWTP